MPARKPPREFAYTTDPEGIPTQKVVRLVKDGDSPPHVIYACPPEIWKQHLDEWIRRRRAGDKGCPEPMPEGHLIFQRPTDYACIPYGCEDHEVKRKAYRAHVAGMLHGWDAGMSPTAREELISHCVEALMEGKELGVAPYMACIASWLRK